MRADTGWYGMAEKREKEVRRKDDISFAGDTRKVGAADTGERFRSRGEKDGCCRKCCC